MHILLGPWLQTHLFLAGGRPQEDWKKVAFFDLVIPSVFAELLPCLGRSQAGYQSTLVLRMGVCCGPQITGREETDMGGQGREVCGVA